MGLFVYVGANFLLGSVITGTTTAESVIRTAVPITLAVVVVGILVNIFKA
jgi:flagellar biosynthesis protein FliQ